MNSEPSLEPLEQLVGRWTTEATHPAMPGTVVRGTAVVEWLEGKRFLIHRASNDHPDFPDSISIIGFTQQDRVGKPGAREAAPTAGQPISMHYYDSRGVSRVCDVNIDTTAWRISRMAPGFSQRFTGTFADGGNTIAGRWQLNEDDAHWKDDLEITYRRA